MVKQNRLMRCIKITRKRYKNQGLTQINTSRKTGHQMRASSESPPANASWICLAQTAITIIQAQLKLYMSEFALSKNAKKKSGKNE